MTEPARSENPPPNRDPILRLFVAVPLWEEFRERNLPKFKQLKSTIHFDLKWVRPENWHLTLKFLGPVPASAVPRLTGSIREQVRGISPFDFQIAGLGGFPRLSKCRVLWVGATEGRAELNTLANRVAIGCREAGHPGDRKNFSAHLTLARSRDESHAIRVSKEIFEASWGGGPVDSVALVKSVMGPGGSKYEILETISF